MSKHTTKKLARRRRRRYIFHDSIDPRVKVYLVYYYDTADVVLMTDGPFKDEPSAYTKMREFLLKGYCAWMVTYND